MTFQRRAKSPQTQRAWFRKTKQSGRMLQFEPQTFTGNTLRIGQFDNKSLHTAIASLTWQCFVGSGLTPTPMSCTEV